MLSTPLFIFVFILLLLGNQSFCRAEKFDYVPVDQIRIADDLPGRNQDGTEFCYGITATQLLQHHYCKGKILGCSFEMNPIHVAVDNSNPRFGKDWEKLDNLKEKNKVKPQQFKAKSDDRLSSLDILLIAGDGKLIHRGNTEEALRAVQKKRAVAKEECAPFYRYSLEKDSRTLIAHNKEWFDDIRSAFKKVNETEAGACKTCEVSKLADSLNLRLSAEEIKKAVESKNIETFSALVLIPEKCQANKVTLKDFKVMTKSPPLKDIIPTIKELLKKGSLVSFSYCDVSAFGVCRDKSGHVIAVRGWRKLCNSENICKEEFNVLNSDQILDENFERWESADYLASNAVANQKISSGETLVWLE